MIKIPEIHGIEIVSELSKIKKFVDLNRKL